MTHNLQNAIEDAYNNPELLEKQPYHQAVEETIAALDKGSLRVASSSPQGWETHPWVKKAILLYFKINKMTLIESENFSFVDKVPVKQWQGDEGVRVVPQAIVRRGAYISPGAVLMPSYVNIGAYVGAGTMVDTWATVGSCAQVGKGVHLSGGVGIGGVLEPLQNNPVIIEDDVFIGSRCVVVEGVHIERGAVLGAGVVIAGNTRIVDVSGEHPEVSRGHVPANAVVIPGTTPKKFPAGEFQVPCALIIGKRSSSTDKKTSLNQVLREHNLTV
ncbi:MAG: 2,3,4,5-tetrahydropyridine-2,6-dicarboxylate N-succinyltransferase [Chlamydiota bacterium]